MIRNTPIFGLLTLIALTLAAPALIGLYLARDFDSLVSRFDRPGVMQVESSRFDRGWFESHARIRLRLDDALCPDTPCPAITLDSTIHHGPIPFTAPVEADAGLQPALGIAETRINTASLWPRLTFEPALAPLWLITRISFDGRALSRLVADAATLNISRGQPVAHVEMSALSAQATVPLRGAGMDAQLDWPAFKFLGESGAQLAWRGLSLTSRRADDGDNSEAGQRLRVESMRMVNRNNRSALMEGLDWTLQPNAAGRTQLQGRIARLVLNNREYGTLNLRGQFEHINPGAWVAMARTLAGNKTASDDATPYQPALVELMATHPRIDIEHLRVTAPSGDIRAHLSVSVPEDIPRGRLLADNIARLELDFSLRVPETITRDITVQVMLANGRSPYDLKTEDVDRALTEMLDRGLLEQLNDGKAYRLRLRIHAGRLALNGINQPGWQAVVDRFEAARAQL